MNPLIITRENPFAVNVNLFPGQQIHSSPKELLRREGPIVTCQDKVIKMKKIFMYCLSFISCTVVELPPLEQYTYIFYVSFLFRKHGWFSLQEVSVREINRILVRRPLSTRRGRHEPWSGPYRHCHMNTVIGSHGRQRIVPTLLEKKKLFRGPQKHYERTNQTLLEEHEHC
jgi:hypothetical protein